MRSRVGKSECSESEAFVGTRGRRADGETFDSEREGGFRGRLQGGASGGKPQVSHNRPLACPARRAQGIITEGIEPSGKLRRYPLLLVASGSPRFLVPCGNNRHFPVFSPSFHDSPPVPSGRGKGACYGGVAPLRGPFPNPRITPLTSR